jgi:hypothetical protein
MESSITCIIIIQPHPLLKVLNQQLLSFEVLFIERTDYNFSQRQILDRLNISDSFYKTLSSLKKDASPCQMLYLR